MAQVRPNRSELDTLLAGTTARDLGILSALHEYRYLDREQIQRLFFDGKRQSQIRTKWLREHHLVDRWLAMQPPGYIRLNSVLLITARGAAVLASMRRHDARPYVLRAREAAEHCLHVTHDLEANGFFVALATAARDVEGEGLYHWLGEAGCRRIYRDRRARIAPDGWGRYLTPEGELVLMLEWDRGTEFPNQLEAKALAYADHFRRRADAELNNVLFVAPDGRREELIRQVLDRVRGRAGSAGCCTFWTTSADRLRVDGALAPVWRKVATDPPTPTRLPQMATRERSTRPVADCIGKPGWWLRRPGGGAGS